MEIQQLVRKPILLKNNFHIKRHCRQRQRDTKKVSHYDETKSSVFAIHGKYFGSANMDGKKYLKNRNSAVPMSFPTRLPEHTDVYFTQWRWPPESGAFITLPWRTQTVSALGCFRLGNTDFDFKIRIPDFTIKHEIRFRISTDRNPFSRRILSIKVPIRPMCSSMRFACCLPCRPIATKWLFAGCLLVARFSGSEVAFRFRLLGSALSHDYSEETGLKTAKWRQFAEMADEPTGP